MKTIVITINYEPIGSDELLKQEVTEMADQIAASLRNQAKSVFVTKDFGTEE